MPSDFAKWETLSKKKKLSMRDRWKLCRLQNIQMFR